MQILHVYSFHFSVSWSCLFTWFSLIRVVNWVIKNFINVTFYVSCEWISFVDLWSSAWYVSGDATSRHLSFIIFCFFQLILLTLSIKVVSMFCLRFVYYHRVTKSFFCLFVFKRVFGNWQVSWNGFLSCFFRPFYVVQCSQLWLFIFAVLIPR